MKITTRDIALIALVAALYVVLTVTPGISALSYGNAGFEIRISEILNFLVFYNRRYVWALTIGVFISNIVSPVGILDLVIGTGQTLVCLLIGLWLFDRFKKQYFGKIFNRAFVYFAIFDAVVGMAIIAAELLVVFKYPYFIIWAALAAGEFISLIIGALVIDQLGRRIDLTK